MLAPHRDKQGLTMALVALLGVGVGFGITSAMQAGGHNTCSQPANHSASMTAANPGAHVVIQDERSDRLVPDIDDFVRETVRNSLRDQFQPKRHSCRQRHSHRHHNKPRVRLGVIVGNNPQGAEIARLMPGMPAEQEGLLVGDVIKSFDGQAIATANELVQLVKQTPRGKKVVVIIIRNGAEKSFDVTLAH